MEQFIFVSQRGNNTQARNHPLIEPPPPYDLLPPSYESLFPSDQNNQGRQANLPNGPHGNTNFGAINTTSEASAKYNPLSFLQCLNRYCNVSSINFEYCAKLGFETLNLIIIAFIAIILNKLKQEQKIIPEVFVYIQNIFLALYILFAFYRFCDYKRGKNWNMMIVAFTLQAMFFAAFYATNAKGISIVQEALRNMLKGGVGVQSVINNE